MENAMKRMVKKNLDLIFPSIFFGNVKIIV